MIGLGEIAAVMVALSWAGSNQIHTAAGKILGPVNLVAVRLPLFLLVTGLVVLATDTSTALPPGALFFLVLAGVTGVTVCDPLLYSAAGVIGARLAVLIQSLSACLAALLGYLFLGENLSLTGWIGILVTSCGVSYVLIEGGLRNSADFSGLTTRQIATGILKALLSALALASYFLFMRQALVLGVAPFWASFINLCIGGAIVWALSLLRGQFFHVMHDSWTSWRIMRMIIFGCLVCTTGNLLSSLAMKHTQAGVAATLIGLQPVMVILISMVVWRKKPSAHAVIGTCIAFSGTAMIFLR